MDLKTRIFIFLRLRSWCRRSSDNSRFGLYGNDNWAKGSLHFWLYIIVDSTIKAMTELEWYDFDSEKLKNCKNGQKNPPDTFALKNLIFKLWNCEWKFILQKWSRSTWVQSLDVILNKSEKSKYPKKIFVSETKKLLTILPP